MAKKNETKERNIERPILLFLILIVLLTGIVCVFITPKSDKEIWLQIGNKVTKGDISYNIKLLEGDEPVEEMSTDAVVSNRINPSFLRFRLTEVVGSEETILKDNQVFIF